MSRETFWTYNDFVPGEIIGVVRQVVAPELLTQWAAIYGAQLDGLDLMPLGILPVLSMQAFVEAVVPRPAGNVHVGHAFRITGRAPVGSALTTSVACIQKQIRRERRVVTLETRARRELDGEEIYSGEITIFWAA